MSDRDAVLDALAFGLSIEDAAGRFGMREAEVRQRLKQETDRVYDGVEQRSQWMLTSRRLELIEVKFARKALDDMDPTAAIVAIKASERRATLTGANAPPAHLVTVMHAQASEGRTSSTERMLEAIRRLRSEPEVGTSDDQSDTTSAKEQAIAEG